MGRQLSIANHCILCLKETKIIKGKAWPIGSNDKTLYERAGQVGFHPIATMCSDCLGLIRGGNWPTDVYAKLSAGRESEAERAEEVVAS